VCLHVRRLQGFLLGSYCKYSATVRPWACRRDRLCQNKKKQYISTWLSIRSIYACILQQQPALASAPATARPTQKQHTHRYKYAATSPPVSDAAGSTPPTRAIRRGKASCTRKNATASKDLWGTPSTAKKPDLIWSIQVKIRVLIEASPGIDDVSIYTGEDGPNITRSHVLPPFKSARSFRCE